MKYFGEVNFFIKKYQAFVLSGIFLLIFSLGFLLNTPSVYAMDMNGATTTINTKNMNPVMQFIESENPIYTPIDVTLDVICIILMLIALFIIIKSIREYGKSTLGIALIYLCNAVLVLGAIKVLFILDDDSLYAYANVKDATEMVVWHTLFYYSIFLFYLAAKTLTGLVSDERKRNSYSSAVYLFIFSVVFSVVLIACMPIQVFQDFWTKYFDNAWFNTIGGFHVIAIILAVAIAVFLYQLKSKFKGYTGVIGNLYIALMFMASIHAWELLNESWRLVIVSDDFGEFIERVLWIPVFLFILYSFIKLRSLASASKEDAAKPQEVPLSVLPQPVAVSTDQQVPLPASSSQNQS